MVSIKPWDLDPTLMMHPGLNTIIAKANEHIDNISKKNMSRRRNMGQTSCLFHTVLNEILKEATVVVMKRGKPVYPELSYLGNILVQYLPDNHVWEITFTNGGKKRKNAKLPLKIMETIYIRYTNGVYWVDSSFSKELRRPEK